MNRAERRRNKSTEKPKTYTLNEEQIRQVKHEAMADAFTILLAIPVLVLHDKFGFGKVRLDRFNHYVLMWLAEIDKGNTTVAEIKDILKREAGIEIMEDK